MRIGAGILGLAILALAMWIYKSRRKTLEDVHLKGVHPDFHQDLELKILEMKRDPEMTEEKWQEMAKISEYADELYKKTHPRIKFFGHLSDLVKNIVDSRKRKK